ncbi:hypothetical protein [Streptomyces sp. x-80]|uniref:hypothetical protein n=1 Tax=Streptomyces sp. x-80 TaxID=2789282 RepID=UPI00397F21CC
MTTTSVAAPKAPVAQGARRWLTPRLKAPPFSSPFSESTIPAYEPHDLDDLTSAEALDAVLDDLRTYRVNPGAGGHFNALRQADLLGHLALRFAGDAYHTHTGDIESANPTQDALTAHQTAATIGRAFAHYTQALPALTKASDPANQSTLKGQVEALTHHSALRRHLDAAQRTLDEARHVFNGVTPLPTNSPAPTVTKPPAPPNPPHGHGR